MFNLIRLFIIIFNDDEDTENLISKDVKNFVVTHIPEGLKEALEFDEDEEGFSEVTFENAEQTPDVFKTPGRGTHKTDSLSGHSR